MEIIVKYSLYSYEDEINLEDWGHEDHVKWEDLSEGEKNEITDHLREETTILLEIDNKND